MRMRSKLALGLGLPDNEQAIELTKAWLDRAEEVADRKRASLTLKALIDKHPEDVLAAALPDPDLRMYAGYSLARLGKRGLPRICEALRHPDDKVRAFALELLDYYGSHHWQFADRRPLARNNIRQAIPDLADVLNSDTEELRTLAAETLGNLGEVEAVASLLAALDDTSARVREAVVLSLGNMISELVVSPLLNLVDGPDLAIRLAALNSLANLANSSMGFYLHSEKDKVERADAVGKLIANRAVEPLISLLDGPNPSVRTAAINALGAIASDHAVEVLLSLVRNNHELRGSVISALEWVGCRHNGVAQMLVNVLEDSTTESDVRLAAIRALDGHRCKAAFTVLRNALNDSDEDVRVAAIEAFRSSGDKRAVEAIITLVTNEAESTRVRSSSVAALGQMRDKRAVEPLLAILSNSPIRSEAISALGWLRDNRAVVPLIDILSDPEGHIRDRAAISLGLLGDSRAVAPLIKMLQTEEVDKRADAARALGRIGDVSALPALEWVRKHDTGICCSTYEARDAAAQAIKNIKRRRKNLIQ